MVELLVVASCGTATYKTETYKNKEMFQNDIENVNDGYKKLITLQTNLENSLPYLLLIALSNVKIARSE